LQYDNRTKVDGFGQNYVHNLNHSGYAYSEYPQGSQTPSYHYMQPPPQAYNSYFHQNWGAYKYPSHAPEGYYPNGYNSTPLSHPYTSGSWNNPDYSNYQNPYYTQPQSQSQPHAQPQIQSQPQVPGQGQDQGQGQGQDQPQDLAQPPFSQPSAPHFDPNQPTTSSETHYV